MMKKVVILAFVSLLTFAVQAQEKTAKIQFKTETVDYGEIAKGSDGIRVFEFTNTGDAPLIISKVSSSCGCTIPKKPEAPIMPGKTGEIQVKYDTNRVGPIRKAVTVISNADTPTKVLKIKGEVMPEGSK
ncbi:DUF1573 domain-containing protein [Zeaxanthinibacter enoshimensis]|uniref:Uncharacterized protein DUF1573 n=2 Tax=Zeaxanthinibacter enoshimensis TaxID=392009 RepID=A0A4R6TK11_9FLAO|nr:uncharacterized protein DUF1573 [Zeaxanthinibacter enoshimensis]